MSDDDEYEIPLQDQRAFGAGIKRQRVRFVPSSSSATPDVRTSSTPAKSISDFYLGLVLPAESENTDKLLTASASLNATTEESLLAQICEVCKLPLSSLPPSSQTTSDDIDSADHPVVKGTSTHLHEASLAHQVCLAHSHPPSHLDRNRKGLAYLASYGWDPDSRQGLGASGQGIQFPIKTKAKDNKMGIGVVLPEESERRKKVKLKKLDAGKIKKLDAKDRKRSERLREMFYQNDDVERYLGGGSS
jgi:hypothetical protein